VLVGCSAGGADRPAASTSVQTNASPTDFTSTTASVRSASPGSGTGSDTGSTSSAGTERVRIVATGDVLLHPTLWAQAEHDAARTGRGTMDFAPMLAGVKPYVASADLALCHLETPLAPTGGPYSGYPTFSGPPQIARALAETGYDVCSTASNHTLDQGVNGVDRTLEHLDRVGIEHAGSARTRREARRTTLVRANGVQVAILSYTYGFNGSGPPTGQSWRAAVIDPDRILRDADRARRAGAQIVVAALHWGTEYSQTPSAEQDALAPKLARSGKLDLIVSHHAHVVEPIEKIGRTWVVHGLGNLLADHATPGRPTPKGCSPGSPSNAVPGRGVSPPPPPSTSH